MGFYVAPKQYKLPKQDLTPSDIESYWAKGIHIKSDGTEIALTDMPKKYLENVIGKFNGKVDTSILQTILNN